ncbi:MAG: ATP-binding protein [Acidimicrobiales bacterium]
MRRSQDERLVAGIAGGLARWLGWDPTLVRVGVVMVSLTGFGVAGYVLAWLFIPIDGAKEPIVARALADRWGMTVAVALLPLLAIALLLGSVLGASWVTSVCLPGYVTAAGLVLVWRNADPREQALLRRAAAPALDLARPPDGTGRRGRFVLRTVIALLLVVGGLVAVLVSHAARSTYRPLVGLLLIIAAIVVVVGPWWLRVARDLGLERQARARAEERAELAARVHDSVLQTLMLIQRRAGQPLEVIQLARAQERELRSWLFEGTSPGSQGDSDATFAFGLHRIQRDVEALHATSVDVVVVGDCALDDGLRSLLAAGREAAVNAAKWSGAPNLSLFGEVEPDAVALFVRDRGAGFDPSAVTGDRKGISESIRGRMARNGGTVAIRSRPGAGTEVALRMSREPGHRTRSPAVP